ncbi:THUMP-like domain-containing protein [Actinomadura scrupuli]|uniref:class I SAM-dependent methyltransferase n=1 Tax=Actinomadura scrupuli TaxID=559629 RepID=UPI003D959C77
MVGNVAAVDIEGFQALLGRTGQAILAEAADADLSEAGLLATASRLRSRHPADLVAAALTQLRLRARARDKFGPDAARMYFTPAGLEQSTRSSVAAHRARRFAAHLGTLSAHGPAGAPPARRPRLPHPRRPDLELTGPEPELELEPAWGPGLEPVPQPGPRAGSAPLLGSVPEPLWAPASEARVLELCCGIGADLVARARAGCPGDGVELDPLTAAVARANLDALGLAGPATVREGDAARQDPAGYAAVFADPGRRNARGRVFDPRAYEPPLDVLLALARRAPAACLKVAPGIPYEAIPADAEAEWISDRGEVKEAALWLGGLSGLDGSAGRGGSDAPAGGGGPGLRRATVLNPPGSGRSGDPGGPATLVPEPGLGTPPVGPWRRYLYEPDGAVIRAHLVAEVAALTGGVLADPNIAYVTSDTLLATPFASAYEIDDVLPFSLKRLRAELRRRQVGILTIKKRGSAVDVERLRRDLRLGGPHELTLVLTRIGAAPFALLCRPAHAIR